MSWTDYTEYLTSHNICSAAAVLSADNGGLVAGRNFTVTNPSYFFSHYIDLEI